MPRKFDVAVILINYNSSQYTLDCIQSIQKQTPFAIRYQMIVVDNNSGLEEFQKLLLSVPENVKVFRSKINLGFSGANMMGIQWADADYYYFLNNDCVLLNDCLGILHAFMETEPAAANASGEMYIEDGSYEYNFRYFPSFGLKAFGSGILRMLNPQRFPSRHTRFYAPTRVDLVNGSSMFIRASAFEKIGGFDTNYFLYCEEEDIALRLKREGFFTYLVPGAHYQHFISRSTTSDSKINLPFLKEFYISLLYYFNKNYGTTHRLAIQIFFFFKIGRKFYRNWAYAHLAFFILKGASVRESLRFRQKISQVYIEKQNN